VELEDDEESIIRSILFDSTHRTLQNNARLPERERLEQIILEQRISLCLDNYLYAHALLMHDVYIIEELSIDRNDNI
jgi:hypothetical protein